MDVSWSADGPAAAPVRSARDRGRPWRDELAIGAAEVRGVYWAG
jgi:hypothetical protein